MKFKPTVRTRQRPTRKHVADEPIEQAFVDVTKARLIEPEFVIKDLCPVGMVILQGPPKEAFKSTLTIITACLTARWQCQALPVWAESMLWGPTMIWPMEAQAGEINWVIQNALRVTPEDNTIWAALNPWEYKLDADDQCESMLAWLRKYRPRLVILDPFRNMWSGDENDSGAIIGALQPLQAWAKENKACLIIVHHVTKPAEGKSGASMYAGRGSGALPGLADGILTIEPGPQQGQIYINAVFKRGSPYRRLVQLGVPGYGWPARGHEVLSQNARRVRERLASGELLDIIAADLQINPPGMTEIMQTLERNRMVPQ